MDLSLNNLFIPGLVHYADRENKLIFPTPHNMNIELRSKRFLFKKKKRYTNNLIHPYYLFSPISPCITSIFNKNAAGFNHHHFLN
jgi:hypothetical protein